MLTVLGLYRSARASVIIVSKWRLAMKVSHEAVTEPLAVCVVKAVAADDPWTPSDAIKEDLGAKEGSITLGKRVLVKRS
jgi:hypothetical protein